MKKLIALLSCLAFFVSACDNKKNEENTAVAEASSQNETAAETAQSTEPSGELWQNISGEPANFEKAFAQLNDVQKYYFCAAFSVGALSVSKPETASAMVNYFLGLGVVRYGQGIDDSTYEAFDSGKHIFRYELVVNDILEKKTCENIMLEATQFAKDNNFTAEAVNDKGKPEVEKIIKKLK